MVRYKDISVDYYIYINEQTYLVWMFIQIFIGIYTVMYDRIKFPKFKLKIKEYNTHITYKMLVLINTFFLVSSLIQIDFRIFSTRSELMDSYGVFYVLWTYSAIITFTLSWIYRKKFKLYFFLGLFSIVFHFYLGDRTSLIISVIAIFMYEFWQKNIWRILILNKIKVLAIIIFIVFGYMSKSVYVYIRAGEYLKAITHFASLDNYIQAFSNSEPFVTQMILNHFIANNISLDPKSLLDLKYQLLLTPSKFKEYESTSDILQNNIFPNVHYGLAGNIWAEMYGYFGFIGIPMFLLLLCTLVGIFNNLIDSGDLVIKAFILVLGGLTCFYLHRNFLENYLTMIRLSSVFVALSIIISIFINTSVFNRRTTDEE